jgi:hypothetical protein
VSSGNVHNYSAENTMGLKNKEPAPSQPDQPHSGLLSDEQLLLHRWRYREARRMDFTWLEAKLFASSAIDVEDMRALARNGCRPDLILRILLD